METCIRLELVATLKQRRPASPDRFPITPGQRVRELLGRLKIHEYEVNLVFIDGLQANLD